MKYHFCLVFIGILVLAFDEPDSYEEDFIEDCFTTDNSHFTFFGVEVSHEAAVLQCEGEMLHLTNDKLHLLNSYCQGEGKYLYP